MLRWGACLENSASLGRWAGPTMGDSSEAKLLFAFLTLWMQCPASGFWDLWYQLWTLPGDLWALVLLTIPNPSIKT